MSLNEKTALAVIQHAEKELAVKQLEISLQEKQEETRRLEIERNTQIALAQIQAQAEDLKDNRTKYNTMLNGRYRFIGVVVVLLLLFAISGIALGAKDMVLEVFKLALGFAAGGFGGYFYGKTKKE